MVDGPQGDGGESVRLLVLKESFGPKDGVGVGLVLAAEEGPLSGEKGKVKPVTSFGRLSWLKPFVCATSRGVVTVWQ